MGHDLDHTVHETHTYDPTQSLVSASVSDPSGIFLNNNAGMSSSLAPISPATIRDVNTPIDIWMSARQAGSSPTGLATDTTPRGQTAQGDTYQTAVSYLVRQVCGESSHLEVDEVLLGIYFTWQAPQHMPVDEQVFRRTVMSCRRRD